MFLTAIALCCLLPVAGPTAPAVPQAALPDTPNGRRVAVFLDAFNRADEPGLVRFFALSMSAERLGQRSAEERAKRIAGLRQSTGRLAVRRADPRPPACIVLVVEAEDKRLLKLSFDFEAALPEKLAAILVDDADPDDLSGPPPPMTVAEALAAIEASVNTAAAADAFSGVVLVARNGNPLLHKAWGLANRELAVPNRTDTKFNLGSINKIFTRVAVAQLLEQNRLGLDDKLAQHLPDYPNPEAARKITIRHLLEMQSGIGDFFGPKFEATPKDRLRKNADFLPLFATEPLLFEPGTGNRYSNGGYIVLGEVVARVSGKDYHQYVRENIYRRAEMTDSDSYQADAIVANLAEGYTREGEGPAKGPRRRNIYSRPACGSAAGGGYSTAGDLLRFVNALLGDRLLTPPWTEWIVGRTEPAPGKPLGDRARGGIGIAGGAPGINAVIEIDRATGWTVIVLTNDDPPMATGQARKVRRLLEAVTR